MQKLMVTVTLAALYCDGSDDTLRNAVELV